MSGTITIEQFQELDIRIGTVVKAEVPEWSHWVTKLTVDLGPDLGERTIFAGIMHFYKSKDLKGKQYPFIVNLTPKKMGPKGDVSQGMLLAVVSKPKKPLEIEGEKIKERPILFEITEKVLNGAKVH